MATWTLLDSPRVNREGNQIELDLYVSGLAGGLDPTLLRSRVNTLDGSSAKTMVSLAGWRTNYSTVVQYYEDPLALPAEVELASGAVVSIDQSGSDVSISISLRLRPTAQVSCGAELRPVSRGLFISQLLADLVVLQETGGGPDEESTTFTYNAGTDTPSAMNLTAYAAAVGKLPGWASGTGVPVLLLHCDSFAERAALDTGSPSLPSTAIASWTDLRLSSPSDLTQATGSLQPALSAASNAAPTVTFDEDLFERAESVDLVQDDCAFGVVFSTGAATATGNRFLIGRWSGSGGIDNSATWQWRLVHERVAGSPDTHKIKAEFVSGGMSPTINTLEATIDEPTEKTIVVYRVNNAGTPTGELWINGVLAATTTSLFNATNTLATQLLTVGGRRNGSGTLVDPHWGTIDQCFAYSTTVSDAALSAIHHELARRAGVELGPIPESSLTQPYTESNPEPNRRLDRWPVAMINLYGGVNYDENVLSQNPNWRRSDGDRQKIKDWFATRIRRIMTASSDFEILINRPQGGYRNDIIASGIFADTDNTFEPVIEDFQWEALSGWTVGMTDYPGVFTEFGLSDHNTRDGYHGPAEFARRCWFYTGNITINDNGEATQDARVGVRNMSPCSAAFYKAEYLDPWSAKDTRFRCFFVDSASKWDRKWVEIAQDADLNEAFTIVGEAITTDANARKGAVWFSMIGIRTAPWWNNFDKTDGYNWSWSAGAWDQTPIYVGITATGNKGDLSLDSPTGVGEQDSLRLEDAYRFVDKGVAPIAWGGDYQKIGTAWMYGARRIPVGRYPMMSPRISRVWR